MNDLVVVKKDVDIESPGGFRRRSRTTVLPLRVQACRKQFPWRKSRLSFNSGVQKPWLIPNVLWFRFVQRRVTDDFNSATLQPSRRLFQIQFAVAEVGPERQERNRHVGIMK